MGEPIYENLDTLFIHGACLTGDIPTDMLKTATWLRKEYPSHCYHSTCALMHINVAIHMMHMQNKHKQWQVMLFNLETIKEEGRVATTGMRKMTISITFIIMFNILFRRCKNSCLISINKTTSENRTCTW